MSRPIPGDEAVVFETRRRRSQSERDRMLDETRTASVSSVARKHGVAKSLLFRWRRDAGLSGKKAKRTGNAFLPVVMPQAAAPPVSHAQSHSNSGVIEIELANGHKLRVSGTVHADALKQAIAALGG